MRSKIGVLTFLLTTTALDALAKERPAVYVRVDERTAVELPPRKRRELLDSVQDLRQQISKRSDISSTRDRVEADIIVTVLDRRIEVDRSGENNWGGGMTQTHYQSRYILAVRVEGGALSLEKETALAGAFVTWRRVAGTVAKDIEEWARENRESLEE